MPAALCQLYSELNANISMHQHARSDNDNIILAIVQPVGVLISTKHKSQADGNVISSVKKLDEKFIPRWVMNICIDFNGDSSNL